MRVLAWCLVLGLAVFGSIACGDGSGNLNPVTPTPTPTPTPPANRAPVITSVTVTPASGIATLTAHAFAAVASDPDGDTLTYRWDFGNGTTSANTAPTVTYTNGSTSTYQATLTVTDARGLSATSSVSVLSTTISGTWNGPMLAVTISATMTQSIGGLVTGTWSIPGLGLVGEIGPAGEPGTIQANGQFDLRFKVRVGSFNDFYYRGTMDPTGQRLTGTLHGSGFTGEYMELEKQPATVAPGTAMRPR